jgi:hypothetical protein
MAYVFRVRDWRIEATFCRHVLRVAEIGWIKKSGLFTAGGRRKAEVRIIWTKRGQAGVAGYVSILKEFGYPSKREFDAFNDLLVETIRDAASR